MWRVCYKQRVTDDWTIQTFNTRTEAKRLKEQYRAKLWIAIVQYRNRTGEWMSAT